MVRPNSRATVIGAGAVAVASGLIASNGWLNGTDIAVVEAISGGPNWIDPVAEVVMIFGSLVALIAVLPFAYLRFSSAVAVLELLAAAVMARITSDLGKNAFGTNRPTSGQGINVREVSDSFAFPSGHATLAFALATVWAARTGSRERALVVALAVVVAAARMYVGAHFVVDVVGGAAAGVLVGLGVNAIAQRITPSRYRRSDGTLTDGP